MVVLVVAYSKVLYFFQVIAGSANGSLKLYDIQKASSTLNTTTHTTSGSVTFDEFDQLTSVHVNSTDKLFLASGYSKDVALYDIGSGTRLQVFANMHQEHINVVKFSNHSPSVFATSSFDKDVKLWDLRQEPSQPCYTASSTKGNVMVCFSPDDRYLLTSAVDNEVLLRSHRPFESWSFLYWCFSKTHWVFILSQVRQLLTVDGRLHLNFDIVPTGSSMNYTRSYYMNGNDYIISGSCDESMVRVCCAQTGRRLRDVSLEVWIWGTAVCSEREHIDLTVWFSLACRGTARNSQWCLFSLFAVIRSGWVELTTVY